jgi:hypothetical protein
MTSRSSTKTHPWEGLINAIDILRENVQDSRGTFEFKFSLKSRGRAPTFQSAFVQRMTKAHGSTSSTSLKNLELVTPWNDVDNDTGQLTSSRSRFKLLNAHNNNNAIVAITRNNTESSCAIPENAKYFVMPPLSPVFLLFSLQDLKAKFNRIAQAWESTVARRNRAKPDFEDASMYLR